MKVPVHPVHWKRCWRAIPTRYPSEKLLARVTDPKDVTSVEQLDALTSTRLRVLRGELSIFPPGERATGPGSQYIMASFAYALSNKSRFGDGSYGVFYGAGSLPTAVDETKHHREEFLRATEEGPMMISMRVLVSNLEGNLHDIRGLKSRRRDLYSPRSYAHSQAFARDLWEGGSAGIVYDSVRHSKGECVAVFRPSVLDRCREERTLVYEWNGERIVRIYNLKEFLRFE